MKELKLYKIGEFAKMLNVTVMTLQRWDNSGKLKAKRTPTNKRFYTSEQYEEFINQEGKKDE